MSNEKNSFVLYLSQRNIIDELSDEEAGILIKAIYEYEETKNVPKLSKMLKLVFLSFKKELDNNEKKYEERCQKNKENIKKYWEKRKKNASSKKNTNVYDRIQSNTNVYLYDNDNDNDNENEDDNDNDIQSFNISKAISKDMCMCNNNNTDTHTPSLSSEIVSCFNKVGIVEPSFVKNKVSFNFKNTKAVQQLIQNVLNKGYTKDDIFDVIYLKYDQWIENNDKNKIDMSVYFKPSTILGDKFDDYHREAKLKGIS